MSESPFTYLGPEFTDAPPVDCLVCGQLYPVPFKVWTSGEPLPKHPDCPGQPPQ